MPNVKRKSSNTKDDQDPWVVGPFGGKNTVLRFQSSALSAPPSNPPAKQLFMVYKIINAENKLVAASLNAHGLEEVQEDVPDFNLIWTGVQPKSETYTTMAPHQRINHFPRSHELTRKDCLTKNIEKLQHSKWSKHFDFMPQTFVLPAAYRELCAAHRRQRGPWIVKPIASSRARGINITNSLDDIPTNENVIVSRYIDNPLLIDGHKCDLRLYVAVTSYDPLVVYVYEEGLVRFAPVKYIPGGKQFWNLCMHLCNYSLNKFHSDYITNDDPLAENVGHKWSLSAFLEHLRSKGTDTAKLMQTIEEMIVKSLLAVAGTIASAVKLFLPHKQNCFEVYGFDIMIDADLKPWLLEVNYSPSLGCDTPLDMRIKSAMLVDLLTLVGLPAVDPVLRQRETKQQQRGRSLKKSVKKGGRAYSSGVSLGISKKSLSMSPRFDKRRSSTSDEIRIVKNARDEFNRRGGFIRIFPSPDSWQRYGSFLEPTTGFIYTGSEMRSILSCYTPLLFSNNYNRRLHQALFPNSHATMKSPLKRLARYERVLDTGHRQLIDFKNTNSASRSSDDFGIDYKSKTIESLHDGRRLNQWQARRVFAQYLNFVLRRVTAKTQSPEDKGQAEQVIHFLQKVSVNLRTPYTVQVPSPQLKGKDRDAVVAKRLFDFWSIYSHETDMYAMKDDRPQFVNNRVFLSFIGKANENDLDTVLSLNTRLYGNAHLYLGRCGVNRLGGPNPLSYSETPLLSSILSKNRPATRITKPVTTSTIKS